MNSVLEYLKSVPEIEKYRFFQDNEFFGNKVIEVKFFNYYLCFIDDRGYYQCFICSKKNLDKAYDLEEIYTLKELSKVSKDDSILKFMQKSIGLVRENIDYINKLFDKTESNKTLISTKIKNTISIREIMLSISKLYMERKPTFQFFEKG